MQHRTRGKAHPPSPRELSERQLQDWLKAGGCAKHASKCRTVVDNVLDSDVRQLGFRFIQGTLRCIEQPWRRQCGNFGVLRYVVRVLDP